MSDTIRVGVVGCGKIADCNHVPELLPIAGARITALCDVVREKAEAMKARHKLAEAAVLTDFKQLLKQPLDAVVICTPNDLHAPMSIAALKQGLHVLVEKPMAGKLADADKMLAASRKAGKILHLNHSLRYHAQYVTFAKLVADGAIGQVQHVRCLRAGGSTPDKSWSPGATWFVQQAHQGGLTLDIGIHMADMMKWIAGPVKEIAASRCTRTPGIDVDDNVSALFRFASGATGVLELSWTMPAGGGLLEVYGSTGRLRMGFGDKPIEMTRGTHKGSETTYPELVKGVPDSHQAFIAAVRSGTPSVTCGEQGRGALALCDAIARAAASGRFAAVRDV